MKKKTRPKALHLAWMYLSVLTLGLCHSPADATPSKGSIYVAMGSSYAAGPGILPAADHPANRCARSENNYAHQLARRLNLALTDVSCSGATTANITHDWLEIPAQVDAVTKDTALVTLTIGGNDLHYAGDLFAASCKAVSAMSPEIELSKCPTTLPLTEANYRSLHDGLGQIVDAVQKRAPKAKIIFVEYPTALPRNELCRLTPMAQADANKLRETARRLAEITEAVALEKKVEVLKFAAMSEGHDACSDSPWMTGYFDKEGLQIVRYHPNLDGMGAIADALSVKLNTDATH